MDFLVDESVDTQVVERLRQDGHDVVSVAETDPGIPDDVVLSRSRRNRRILLTADKDFGDLVYRQHKMHSGVVLVRLFGLVAGSRLFRATP